MVQRSLFAALLVGFWVPPLMAGRWVAGRRQRVLNLPLTAVAWSLIWFVSEALLVTRHVPKGPDDFDDSSGLFVAGLLAVAFTLVLPISAIACWIGTLRGTPASDKLKFGFSLIIFALIQVLFVAYLIAY